MKLASWVLIIAAVGLLPIALSYGVSPTTSMSYLFDIDSNEKNLVHIFRAVMGLYLGMAIFWIYGAKQDSLRTAALWSLTVFMFGLASGRILSLVVDGIPHPLLIVYLILEVGFGMAGVLLLRR